MRRAGEERGVATPVRIRPMAAGDVPEILRIERESFSVPWSEATFRNLLRRPNAVLLVAEGDGASEEVVGYAALWVTAGEAELGDIAVRAPWRRRGIGRALLRACIREARRRGAAGVFLEVRASNEAARALYEAHGFRTVGRRPGYYVRPVEDAVVMRLDDEPRVR